MSMKSVCGMSCGEMHEFALVLDKVGFNADLVQKIINEKGNRHAKMMYAALTDGANILANNIILVDRSISPSYPDWVETVMHPELEMTGPAEYDISAVEQWLHEKQKNDGYIEGREIYRYLKNTDTLGACLGLRDLEEIQKKGVAFFGKHFQDKCVFGWKGVVRHRLGSLHAPCLREYGGKVVLHWRWLINLWFDLSPALRLASSSAKA